MCRINLIDHHRNKSAKLDGRVKRARGIIVGDLRRTYEKI